MKQLIIPIAIIVALIAFFVIIDRKEFSHHADVQTGQSESLTTNTKPTASVSQAKPVTEVKPAGETQPIAEAKTAETKPVSEVKTKIETKPAETKSVTESAKSEDKAKPAAVSVVTAEDAEKLNEFALFLSTAKMTVVEGEIVERSELPAPEKTDYPDCRFTMHFIGNSIKQGEPCPKELSLIAEGFMNYHILPNNDIKAGNKVQCSIIPFDRLPEDYQSTQQADDLELFLLESYYVVDIKTIRNFTDDELNPLSGIFFSDGNKDYISLFDRHINPEIPDAIKIVQKEAIKADLDKANELLKGYDDEKIRKTNLLFSEAWNKEKAKDPPNYNRVREGKYVWRNIKNSFWTLPTAASSIVSKPDMISEQMLDCFLSLKNVLEANGVQLIVSLVPAMNDISARVINNEFKDVPDLQTATYVKQLSEIGIETIYASDLIIKNYNRFPIAYLIPEDLHPADTTQDILADILAERLKRYEIRSELDSNLFSEVQFPHVYQESTAYLYPENCDIGENQAGNPYMCRVVLYAGEKIKKSKESPIMVVGNSFMESLISTPESLPTLLSYKLRSTVDWHRNFGYGPFSDLLTQLLSNPEPFLKNKVVCIIQIGTMHITAVNRMETMLDIGKLDSGRVLLNNKKMKEHFFLQSNTNLDSQKDHDLWAPLSSVEKSVLTIDESGVLSYRFNLEHAGNGVTDFEPIVVIIPHTCFRNTTCKATVNGKTELMQSPNFPQNSRFFNLTYELPAGTKEITLKFEGKPGSLIAIKDIQIWQ